MSKLLCGASRIDITPSEEELKDLFGLMGIGYAGIIDRLSLRVIALKNDEETLLIVAFDLDKGPNPSFWLPLLSKRTGVPEDKILYFATHTHSAPLTTVRPREKNRASEAQREAMLSYEATVLEKLLGCADEAIKDLQPARMGCAYGESFVNVNRNANFVYTDENGTHFPYIAEGMNWGAPVDRTLLTIRFETPDGDPIAFFVNYPMHCCLMFLNNYDGEGSMGVSGDIAGNVSTLMEEKYPGSVAIWSSGAAGDVDPVLFNVFIYPDPKDGHTVKEPISDWKVSLSQLNMIVGWHFADICRTIETIECSDEESELNSMVTWSETPSEGDSPYRIRLHGFRIGDALLLGIGGELYNSYGVVLREHCPAPYFAVVNHAASIIDDAGYILDDDALGRAAQDAPCPHFIPGSQARFLPGHVGPSLISHLDEITAAFDIRNQKEEQ